MARLCNFCGRGSLMSATRSHSNIATKHRQFVNLQTKRVDGVKTRVCTRCLRTASKATK